MKLNERIIKWVILLALPAWVAYDLNGKHIATRSHPLNSFLLRFIYVAFWIFACELALVLIKQNIHKLKPDTHDLEKQVDRFGAKYVIKRPNAGLVIALYQRGKRCIKGYGRTDQAYDTPPDGKTLYEIGSVTKVFTALTLAKLAVDGSLKMMDPLSRHLPATVACPQKGGREPTLEQIATHTSGLPRLPDDLLSTMKDGKNPYVHYTAEHMFKCLARTCLESVPGKTLNYSNFGFGVLGKILELKSGMSYEDLIQQGISAPLGLMNTTTRPSAEQKMYLTRGHDPSGAGVPNWDMDGMVGCGALYSNAEDLLKFVEANLTETNPKISQAVHEAQKVHFRTGWKGFCHSVGLGWQIEEDLLGKHALHWHNGGTGGYVSFVGFDKDNQVGVVILSNYGDAMAGNSSTDRMGMRLLKLASRISLRG
jgi:D-alanyl-D-alanine-carboxypeptidase/D-alanyl-D-alanine-endopeptidase